MYTMLSTGDVPGASTYFNPLVQQSTVPCTSGTRPSSPPDGMMIYETDSRFYRSYNSATGTWNVMGANARYTMTPTLTAAGGNPTPGTGVTRVSHWTRGPDGMVFYTFHWKFGTGPNPGSGQYLMSLPVTASVEFGGTDPEWWGSCRVVDSGTQTYTGSLYIPGSNPNVVAFQLGNSLVANNVPFTFAASDELSGSIHYRAVNGL